MFSRALKSQTHSPPQTNDRLIRVCTLTFTQDFMLAYRQSLELFSSFVFDKPPPPLKTNPPLVLDEKCAFYKRFQDIRHKELRRIVRDDCLPSHKRVISLSAQIWNDEGKPTIDKLSARSYATAMVAAGLSPTGRITLVYLKIGMLLAFNMYRLSVFAAKNEANPRHLLSSVQVKHAIADVATDKELFFGYFEEWIDRFTSSAQEVQRRDAQIVALQAANKAAMAAAIAGAHLSHEAWIRECKDLLVPASRNKVGERGQLYNVPLLVRYLKTLIPGTIVHILEKIPRVQDDATIPSAYGLSILASTATSTTSTLSQLSSTALSVATKKRERPPQLSCLMCCRVCEGFALQMNGLSDAARAGASPLAAHKQMFHSTTQHCGACAVPLCDVARHTFGGKTCFDAFHDGRQIVHPLVWQAFPRQDVEASGVVPFDLALTLSTMRNRSSKRPSADMQVQIEAAKKRLSFGNQDDDDNE